MKAFIPFACVERKTLGKNAYLSDRPFFAFLRALGMEYQPLSNQIETVVSEVLWRRLHLNLIHRFIKLVMDQRKRMGFLGLYRMHSECQQKVLAHNNNNKKGDAIIITLKKRPERCKPTWRPRPRLLCAGRKEKFRKQTVSMD